MPALGALLVHVVYAAHEGISLRREAELAALGHLVLVERLPSRLDGLDLVIVTMIDGLVVTPLRRIPDERGAVLHMLRNDSPAFERFGEIYFSTVYPGVVKAWHLHQEMKLNYAVPVGMIKLVCYDDRVDSPTKGNLVELHVGELNYCLVTIPPLVWNGFKGEGTGTALVANCSTIPHYPDEIRRVDPFDNPIPYSWDLRHG